MGPKSIVVLLMSILAGISFPASSQVEIFPIQEHKIHACFDKTVSVVFPAAIKSVDKGTRELLVQKVKGAENILQLKGAKSNFSPTSMSVLTADGTLYSFRVFYSSDPVLALKIMKDGKVADALFTGRVSEWESERTALWIAESIEPVTIIRKKKYGITLQLAGVYIRNDALYYRIRIQNHTPIGYDISGLRFFIRNKNKVRRRAIQERELIPFYTHGNTLKVAGDSENSLVFALPKHSLSARKYLAVDLSEVSGGRSLELKVGYSTLRKAISLPASFELSKNQQNN